MIRAQPFSLLARLLTCCALLSSSIAMAGEVQVIEQARMTTIELSDGMVPEQVAKQFADTFPEAYNELAGDSGVQVTGVTVLSIEIVESRRLSLRGSSASPPSNEHSHRLLPGRLSAIIAIKSSIFGTCSYPCVAGPKLGNNISARRLEGKFRAIQEALIEKGIPVVKMEKAKLSKVEQAQLQVASAVVHVDNLKEQLAKAEAEREAAIELVAEASAKADPEDIQAAEKEREGLDHAGAIAEEMNRDVA